MKGAFEEAAAAQKASFERMYASLPSVPPEYEPARREAAVLFWTAIAGPRGMFRRPMMLMSNNWMNKTWSWDHAINALSLGYRDQDAAWEQFRCMFDFMSVDGMMPDMVSDEQIYWLAVKPPVHGWVFSKLRAIKEFPRDRLETAYGLIGKWTDWWLRRVLRREDRRGPPRPGLHLDRLRVPGARPRAGAARKICGFLPLTAGAFFGIMRAVFCDCLRR